MLQSHEALAAAGVKVRPLEEPIKGPECRSVSIPSMEIFKQQPQECPWWILHDSTCFHRVFPRVLSGLASFRRLKRAL